MKIIDLHTDLATNALDATGKDIGKRHKLKEGTPQVAGVVANNNIDIPRLKEGDVKIVFSSIFALDKESYEELINLEQNEYDFTKLESIKFGLEAALEQMSYYMGILEKYRDELMLIKSRVDLQKVMESDQIGLLIHLEGIDYVDKKMEMLEVFYKLGARSLALTWRNRNNFGSGNNVKGGLSAQGRSLVKKVNKMGMVMDLAHTNEETFWDIIEIVDFPVVVSHTLSRSICDNSRNLTDEQIKAVAITGGVLGMAAIPEYIGGDILEDYVDHFEHIIGLVGDEHVCFGTDFDGLVGEDDIFMEGFTGPDGFPNVIEVFKKRGFSRSRIEKVCYKNAERIIKESLR